MPTHIQTHTCAPDLCAHPTCVRPILAPTRSVRPHDRHVRAESPVVSICTFSPNRSLFPPEHAEKAVVRPWAWRQAGAECAAGERAEREMAACVCVCIGVAGIRTWCARRTVASLPPRCVLACPPLASFASRRSPRPLALMPSSFCPTRSL